MNSRQPFKEQVARLFYKFLKEHKIFNRVYRASSKELGNYPPTLDRVAKHDITDMWLDYADYLAKDKSSIYRLQMSQLWRFYLLEHVDELDFSNGAYNKDNFTKSIKSSIRSNGDRKSEEIRKLIKEYKIYE